MIRLLPSIIALQRPPSSVGSKHSKQTHKPSGIPGQIATSHSRRRRLRQSQSDIILPEKLGPACPQACFDESRRRRRRRFPIDGRPKNERSAVRLPDSTELPSVFLFQRQNFAAQKPSSPKISEFSHFHRTSFPPPGGRFSPENMPSNSSELEPKNPHSSSSAGNIFAFFLFFAFVFFVFVPEEPPAALLRCCCCSSPGANTSSDSTRIDRKTLTPDRVQPSPHSTHRKTHRNGHSFDEKPEKYVFFFSSY